MFVFLGDGIEENELAEDVLKREVLKESRYSLKKIRIFDKVASWCYNEANGYMNVDSTIYIANFDKNIANPIEKDHEII